MLYSEYRHYSVTHDREMSRLSMTNARGQEYFVLVPCDDGRRYKANRDDALDMIEQAINMGLPPGQVVAA